MAMERDGVLDELRGWIGREHAYAGVDEVSRNDIRRKLEVYCFHCPLYTDDATARAHGYRMAVAPTAMTLLWSLQAYWSAGDPAIFAPGMPERDGSLRMEVPSPYSSTVNAGMEVEYFEPLYPGDRLHGVWKLIDVKPKQTRLGEGAFFTFENRLWKQTEELVAVRRSTSFQYDRRSDPVMADRKSEVQEPPAPAWASPADNPEIEWERQLTFEDVKLGDQVPPYRVWLSYQRIVMSIAVDRMFSGIHHNRDFARAQGLDDIIFNTRGYETVFEITLRRWMGLAGRLRKMGPFRMVSNGHPGDTLVCGARVTGKEVVAGRGVVVLETWVDSPRRRAAQGEATVWLPLAR